MKPRVMPASCFVQAKGDMGRPNLMSPNHCVQDKGDAQLTIVGQR